MSDREFWKLVWERLDEAERTQAWLARQCGYSRQRLNLYSTGRVATPVAVRVIIATFLDIREEEAYVPCSGCGVRNYDTRNLLWNCPDFPNCARQVA